MNKNTTQEMSEATRTELFLYYSRIPNTGFHPNYVQKRLGLMMIGLSEDEAERMCEPKKIDQEQLLADVMEEQKRNLKDLAKLDRERDKTERLSKSDPIYKNYERQSDQSIYAETRPDPGC